MTEARLRVAIAGTAVTAVCALALVVLGVTTSDWPNAATGALGTVVAALLALRIRHVWNRR
jgi:hypothetical protein